MVVAVGRVAGVGQSLLGHHQAQKLGGVSGLHVLGGDAESQRREGHLGDEGAPSGVNLVARLGIGVEIVLYPEMVGRDVGDRVAALEDEPPVSGHARLFAGKEGAQPDDGHAVAVAWGLSGRGGRRGLLDHAVPGRMRLASLGLLSSRPRCRATK